MAKQGEIGRNEVLLYGGVALVLYVVFKGGIRNAATAAGQVLVDAAGGIITGGVDAAGQQVGLPSLADITTNARVARYIIDHPNGGSFEASKWASATAFGAALFMDRYSGTPPSPSSRIYQLFPPYAYTTPAGEMVGPPADDGDVIDNDGWVDVPNYGQPL